MMPYINTDFFSFSNGNTKNAYTLLLIDRFFVYNDEQKDTLKGLVPMTKPTASFWIHELLLQPHAEGGYFRETGHSPELIVTDDRRERYLYSNILFADCKSASIPFSPFEGRWSLVFPMRAAPYWSTCCIPMAVMKRSREYGAPSRKKVNSSKFTVPERGHLRKQCRRGSSGDYALVSCMVSPGFDYNDFELLTYDTLIKTYPDYGAFWKN